MESRAAEPEPGVFGAGAACKKNLEPEPKPLGKKKSGAAGSSALLEDKKHKKSVRLFLF